MKTTYHSEYHQLKSVFIKPVQNAFVSEKLLEEQWQELHYLSQPYFQNSFEEYEIFKKAIQKNGALLKEVPFNDNVTIDSIYCRDASIVTDFGMIICNMGKEGRINEPAAQERAFESNGIPVLGVIAAPGTLEGGDVAWLDDKTLAVGHTYRTNEEGIRQLSALLAPLGVSVLPVAMPHYKGPSDVFHLMSVLSPVDSKLAVVYSPLIPIVFRNELIARGYEFVEVPDTEFDSMGCNVLALAPRVCLMVKGNPITKSRLEKAGCKVIEYNGEEISVKGGGGPTCLTRPIMRD